MITFEEGEKRFTYRVAGIALDVDRVLLLRTEKDDFWFLPGGRVELLELSQDALIREMQEELEVKVTLRDWSGWSRTFLNMKVDPITNWRSIS